MSSHLPLAVDTLFLPVHTSDMHLMHLCKLLEFLCAELFISLSQLVLIELDLLGKKTLSHNHLLESVQVFLRAKKDLLLQPAHGPLLLFNQAEVVHLWVKLWHLNACTRHG